MNGRMMEHRFSNEYGEWVGVFTQAGLSQLFLPGSGALDRLGQMDEGEAGEGMGYGRDLERVVERLLYGQEGRNRIEFPLDLTSGTAFQQRVWRQLLEIPGGELVTYQELAKAVGKPMAARAVGNACGRNPIPLLIPCHRVVRSNGEPGGYSAGLDWKERLLKVERRFAQPGSLLERITAS